MPSLRALEEFKSSFDSLGGELRTLAELDLPRDDLPLPDHEPAFLSPAKTGDPFQEIQPDIPLDVQPGDVDQGFQDSGFPDTGLKGSDDDFIDFGDLGDLLGGSGDAPVMEETWDETGDESGSGPQELSGQEEDLSDFIDAIPDDLTPPGLLDGFADEIEADSGPETPPEDDLGFLPADESPAGDDFSMDDILGSGSEDFGDADFLEDDTKDTSADETPEEGDFPSFDLENSLELHGEDPYVPVASNKSETIFTQDPDFPADEFFLTEDTGEQEDEVLPADEHPAEELDELQGFEDADFGDAADFEETAGFDEAGHETEGTAAHEDSTGGFDLGGESVDFGHDAILEEIPGDSFDNFNVDSNALAGNFDLGIEDDFGSGMGDEFALPGMDSSFGQKPGPRKVSRDLDEEIEEINLSDEELEQLHNTLSSYPLNLRIACEEIIAEMAVAPDMMSELIKLLVTGASAKETAALAGKIMERTIPIPKGFEKKTGEALEAEQSSFAYIFVHNFLPVFRLFLMIALVVLSAGYLCWKFIYTPLRAEKIYKLGIERIQAGEYGRANDRFREAYKINQKKSWFYEYARAFRDARQYTLAEEKYQELLYFTASKNKQRIPEKQAVLEYADLETNYIGNYEAADNILRRNILDYRPLDREALLALGDNALIWGEYESARLEDARESYARYMERYGRSDPLLERMLKYFIRTDNLEEVLQLQTYFMQSTKRIISASSLAELGGYLLDKRYEKIQGVPNEFLDSIGGIREVLLRAVSQDSMLPETYYHLARYYYYYENFYDERLTLDLAVRVFEHVSEETPKRIKYHLNTLRRYGEVLVAAKEFFPAEEAFIKAVNIYQDALSRRLLTKAPEFGRIYANLGDLEYFVKEGDWKRALDYYRNAELNGWAPPEIQYRMGAAHYQMRQWGPALDRFFTAHRELPPNRRILYALGNVSYMRGNYFAAQGYYDRLLEMLEADRSRLPPIMATDDETGLDLAERLMVAQNNLAVTLDALTERTGNNKYRSRAHGLYADSERAWDILTRDPKSMLRMKPSPEINAPGINPAFLNIQNSLRPIPGYEAKFFLRIDKDIVEPSAWEELAPPGFRLSEGIYTGR